MKVTSINVRAGRTFNHPTERFANFTFSFDLSAELEDGDTAEDCLARLQAQAEAKAEAHKKAILDDIAREQEIARTLEQIEYVRRQTKQHEENDATIAKLEAALSLLTSKPLMLAATKQVHAGHPDHPETDEDFARFP